MQTTLTIASNDSTGSRTLTSKSEVGTYYFQIFGDIDADIEATPAGTSETAADLPQLGSISNASGWSDITTAFVPAGLEISVNVTAVPGSGSGYIFFGKILA